MRAFSTFFAKLRKKSQFYFKNHGFWERIFTKCCGQKITRPQHPVVLFVFIEKRITATTKRLRIEITSLCGGRRVRITKDFMLSRFYEGSIIKSGSVSQSAPDFIIEAFRLPQLLA